MLVSLFFLACYHRCYCPLSPKIVHDFADYPGDPPTLLALLGPKPELWDPNISQALFFADHYIVSLGDPSAEVVTQARYWYALFSHRRDGLWKGILEVDLKDKADDDAARIILGNQP